MAPAAASSRVSPLDIAESHAPAVRMGAVIGSVSAVVLFAAGVITGESIILLGAAGSLLWLVVLLAMMWLERENGIVGLALGTLLVSVYAVIADIHEIDRVASLSVVLAGVATVLFLDRFERPFLWIYSLLLVAAHLAWVETTGEAFAESVIAVMAFVAGAVALRWIRDRSQSAAGRFINLFERAPVSIWEEDYSRVGDWIEELRAQGVRDLHTFLIEDPAALREGMSRIEVVRVNQAAADFLEVDDPSDLVGPLKPETFPDDALPSMAAQFEAIWDGVDHVTTEVRQGYTTEGNPIDGLLHWAVPRRFGKPDLSRVIVSVVDVTAMNDVRRDLEKTLESKDELIATVSHELRTPLTTVVGLSSELSQAFDDFEKHEVQDLMSMISEQSLEVATIVEDLLVAARAESGSLKVNIEPVDVHLEVKTTLRGLEIEEEVDCHTVGIVATAAADSGRVRQIIRNLVVNARRYGVSPVRVIVRNDGENVAIEVRDHGDPIPLEEREAVFERYYRARRKPGLTASVGLGLTVSRELARIMGGDVTYHHDGESVFTVTFPQSHPESAAAAG